MLEARGVFGLVGTLKEEVSFYTTSEENAAVALRSTIVAVVLAET